MLGVSLFFILVSAVPMVDNGNTSFPKMSKFVSDFTAPSLMASPQIKIISGTVKNGDTDSSLLNIYIPLKKIYDLDHRSKEIFSLTRIRQGHPYKISLLEDSFVAFEYEIKQKTLSVDIRICLSEAVKRSGEYPSLTLQLADIFAWDIDFINDIQPGDLFKVLVEKWYRNEKYYEYSDIKAAFIINKGVDYAAPKNTPIKTIADGTVVSIGYNNSMGKNITIRHFNGYETSYLHINKYAKGMKKNKKVIQGDVIGYVGNTGLTTGYHLCFRMRKQGRLVNPLKQTTDSSKPLLQKEMGGFIAQSMKYSEKIMAAQKLSQATP